MRSTRNVPEEAYRKYKDFEDFIFRLFEKVGYQVKKGQNHGNKELIYRENQNEKYIFEIKFSSKKIISSIAFTNGLNQLSNAVGDGKRILIFNALCPSEYKSEEKNNIEIIDLRNLFYLANCDNELHQRLLGFLDFFYDDIEETKPSIPLLLENQESVHVIDVARWGRNLNLIVTGKKGYQEYEKLCTDILRQLFSNYLSIWKKQKTSNDGLYRFDLICKTKSDIKDDFFWTINKYFNTRYIIFEFKNYSTEISSKEVYATEKYLYDKALRKVAIIISRKPFSKNAQKAANGCLRENGKVIINLTDRDLITLLDMHNRKDNPADYLSQKLDDLLVELEK